MRVEIDQSGKLEHLDTDTVIAFANGHKHAVLVKAGIKRKIIALLKRSIYPHDQIMPLLFAVCIFILIKDAKLDNKTILTIDEEYTGKYKVISDALYKKLSDKWLGNIRFAQIGKSSPAHNLAWSVHRNKLKFPGIKKVSLEELLVHFSLKN